MSGGRLLWRNLWYHWRGNLAVLLGVAVGAAVLTGALLVGDSLRGSLRHRTLEQLGWVEQALVTGRFFRSELAKELGVEHSAPLIVLRGATTGKQRVNQVTIYGVDYRFRGETRPPPRTRDREPWEEVSLNATLARELGVKAGDRVTLHLQKVSPVPRETVLGRRQAGDVLDEIHVTVTEVLADEGAGRFSLSPSLGVPRNVFVPLADLQERLDQKGRVNAILVAGAPPDLQERLHQNLTLDDWGLVLYDPDSRAAEAFRKADRNGDAVLTGAELKGLPDRLVLAADPRPRPAPTPPMLTRAELERYYRQQRPYLSLESRQMLLEPATVDAALAAAKQLHLTPAKTLVYLANRISDGTHFIPYSVVAALDPALPPPLGLGRTGLKDGEILLADWKGSPLKARPGDRITVTYFEPEEQGGLREGKTEPTLRGFVPMTGLADDPDLTPEFPGITDKLTIQDWNPPFPYEPGLVKKPDERFWDEYRTTPKAYVTLTTGQRLWHSRFGNLTSIRLAPANVGQPADLHKVAKDFRRELLANLKPERGGFVFDNVRERGLKGTGGFVGGMDFGWLLVCFSFFLIAAALLLVGLLFRLNLDRRASEVGLLLATGHRLAKVRRLLLAEGGLLAGVGALLGLFAAAGYAWLLLELLRAWWPGAMDRSFLHLYLTEGYGLSFLIGYGATVAVSVVTIFCTLLVLGRVPPRALLTGVTETDGVGPRRPRRWSLLTGAVSLVGALACVVTGAWLRDPEMRAMTFFGSGFLLLVGALALGWAWMRGTLAGNAGSSLHPGSSFALLRLGVRNAARHPVRSLLTAGLLASATFLVVAVASFHRDADMDFFDTQSGSGGFNFLAESDVPVYQDLNTERGRLELDFPDNAGDVLQGTEIVALRLRPGEDASCLNLYQPSKPRVLGVPHSLIKRGGFRFESTEAWSAEERDDPWLLLEQIRGDSTVGLGRPDLAIPVFGESSAVQYILNSNLGQEITVPDENGNPVQLRFVGLFKDSAFQSEVVMSEGYFLRLYPHQEGYQFFLIRTPRDRASQVKEFLEKALAKQGFTITPTQRRLETYLKVENTYLATFQALGALGLLLGTLGLAVVLLRSVWERRGELALLRALGFRRSALGRLVLAENVFLLLLGLGIGTATALVAVAPHLASGSGAVPVPALLGLLGLVLVVALVAAGLAVAATLRAPLLPALRRE
jgi:ABC-type lipoprotein release transport system permease subunit